MPHDQLVQSSLVLRETPFGGPLVSADLAAMFDEIRRDLNRFAAAINRNAASDASLLNRAIRELSSLQGLGRLADDLELQELLTALSQKEIFNPQTSLWITADPVGKGLVSFSRPTDLRFDLQEGRIPETRRLRWDRVYGELTLPLVHQVNRFYQSGSVGQQAVVPRISPSANPISYPGGKVTETDPRNAFNGDVRDIWVRRVEFPLSANVSEVEATLSVNLPQTFGSDANTLVLHPYPAGQIDILDVLYGTALGGATLPLFTTTFDDVDRIWGSAGGPVDASLPLLGITTRRFFFPAVQFNSLKIILRQRNWIEEQGKKVFYLGFQHVGVQLTDYDKNPMTLTLQDSNVAVVRYLTPKASWNLNGARPLIKKIRSWVSDQGFTYSGGPTTGIRFQVYKPDPGTADLGTLLYDSSANPRPQSNPPDTFKPAGDVDSAELFIRIDMQRNLNLTPVLRSFSFDYTTGIV